MPNPTSTDQASNCNQSPGMYFSVPSSARSPTDSSTGVMCVWKPVMVLGRPACKQRVGAEHQKCLQTSQPERQLVMVRPRSSSMQLLPSRC